MRPCEDPRAGTGPVPDEEPVVDATGKPCPLPVIELARAMAARGPGQGVVVLSDDPGSRVDIPTWCRMRGAELVAVADRGAATAFTVRWPARPA